MPEHDDYAAIEGCLTQLNDLLLAAKTIQSGQTAHSVARAKAALLRLIQEQSPPREIDERRIMEEFLRCGQKRHITIIDPNQPDQCLTFTALITRSVLDDGMERAPEMSTLELNLYSSRKPEIKPVI